MMVRVGTMGSLYLHGSLSKHEPVVCLMVTCSHGLSWNSHTYPLIYRMGSLLRGPGYTCEPTVDASWASDPCGTCCALVSVWHPTQVSSEPT